LIVYFVLENGSFVLENGSFVLENGSFVLENNILLAVGMMFSESRVLDIFLELDKLAFW